MIYPVSLSQLLGPYGAEPWTDAELASGRHLCTAWNTLATAAAGEGVILPLNPATGSSIGGTGNGGARPKGSKVGAPGSKHQLLLALDWFDPKRALMGWILTMGRSRAATLGLFFEHPQWTRNWTHGQIVPPGSGSRFFVPYADLVANPPTCAALPGQAEAGARVFDFEVTA